MSRRISQSVNENKVILLIMLVSFLILGGGIFLVSKTSSSPQVEYSLSAKAWTVESTSFDWGQIPMYNGLARKTFTIKNTGTDLLKLFNIKTSCHCTVARISIDGKESQNFGMSGVSSWVGEVKPGKEAKLIAEFDPAYHGPQGVGPITRFVSVETNDKGNQKITFTLTGTVYR